MPFVETDDPVLRHHLTNIVDDPLRSRWITALLRPVGDVGKDALAQRKKRLRLRHSMFEPVGQQGEARPDVAY
jgi:hypothetical protein